MNKLPTQPSSGSANSTSAQQGTAPVITIEQLAAKVYQLMVEDARLSRIRGDSSRARK